MPRKQAVSRRCTTKEVRIRIPLGSRPHPMVVCLQDVSNQVNSTTGNAHQNGKKPAGAVAGGEERIPQETEVVAPPQDVEEGQAHPKAVEEVAANNREEDENMALESCHVPEEWTEAKQRLHAPQQVEDYADAVFARLSAAERNWVPAERHPRSEVNSKMRAILVDWLVEVHQKFKLMPETLYLCVSLLDRYLAKVPVRRVKLQQVGVSCLFIASKYEEIHPPEIGDLVYITDKSSSREDICETEIDILNALEFRIAGPTMYHYLRYYESVAMEHRAPAFWDQDQMKAFYLAQYTLEMSLMDYNKFGLLHPPSKLAASALFMAKKVLRVSPSWPAQLEKTGYSPSNGLKGCAKELVPLVTNHGGAVNKNGSSGTEQCVYSTLKSVKTKYAGRDKMGVAYIHLHMQ